MPETKRADQIIWLDDEHKRLTEQAWRALYRGNATSAQQKRVIVSLLQDMCGIFDLEPSDIPEDVAAFTRGKRWIGIKASLFMQATLLTFKADDNGHTDTSD